MNKSTKIITRFAPSPTGYFHAGSYRTALFSWIFQAQNKGKFVLRIEDTDKERSKKEYEENIVESLQWLGLKYDEFYRQSDRTDIYKKYIKKLIDSGNAFVSEEYRKDKNGIDTNEKIKFIRFKNPKKKVAFEDLIRGKIEFDTTELGDFIIAKGEDEPLFHLVVVVDDHDMGITHIIRGEDHISNTPRQILIYEALGVKPPLYAHIPLLLASDRSKLSKRHGALPISEYRNKGYLKEAVINYLALLGWHPSDDREILSIDEIIKEFSLERVQKSGAIFSEEKLAWFNREYIRKLDDTEFINRAGDFFPDWLKTEPQLLDRVVSIVKEKINNFSEINNLFSQNNEMSFIQKLPEYKSDMLLWKKAPSTEKAHEHLSKCLELISHIPQQDFNPENLKGILWPYVEKHGKGDVLWPLRVALTGQDKSPDPFVSAYLLGKDESLTRIKTAIAKLV